MKPDKSNVVYKRRYLCPVEHGYGLCREKCDSIVVNVAKSPRMKIAVRKKRSGVPLLCESAKFRSKFEPESIKSKKDGKKKLNLQF